MTRAEVRVWRWLRDRRFGNHKFRRQYPIGPYILDFYCEDLKLAVEIDGSCHGQERDSRRTLLLNASGIFLIRIDNKTVLRMQEGAGDQIRAGIEICTARRSA